MIYGLPAPDDAIDQADLIDGCPILSILKFDPADPRPALRNGKV